jgi:hypothetical protein
LFGSFAETNWRLPQALCAVFTTTTLSSWAGAGAGAPVPQARPQIASECPVMGATYGGNATVERKLLGYSRESSR